MIQPPCGQLRFRRPTDRHQLAGAPVRASPPQCASPHSRSARPSSSCRPSGLRKRQRSFPSGASSIIFPESSLPARTCSAPRFRHRDRSSRHGSSPPCRLRSLGIKRCPRHSRRFRSPTVVCAAWSFLRDRLTPLPPAAGAAIVCFVENKLRPTSGRATFQQLKKEAEQGRGCRS